VGDVLYEGWILFANCFTQSKSRLARACCCDIKAPQNTRLGLSNSRGFHLAIIDNDESPSARQLPP
jgi:hypothetical protein